MENMILAPYDSDVGRGDLSQYRCHLEPRASARTEESRLDAPPHLQWQVNQLIAFKTADFSPIGKYRGERWASLESVRAHSVRLEMFFGALRHEGKAVESLSLVNILSERDIQTVLDFLRARRGIYTTSTTSVLLALASHLEPKEGFVAQSRDLFPHHPAAGSPENWAEACAKALAFIWQRYGELQNLIQQGRDPFAPILVVVDADRPRDIYYRIVEEIRLWMPSADEDPLRRARLLRFLMSLRYPLKLPLRAKNLVQCGIVPKGAPPTPMNVLARQKRPELWFDDVKGRWLHRQPKSAFKNWHSAATSDVEIELTDTDGFVRELEEYISLRPVLLNGHPDQWFCSSRT
jgi:hypothetical protein